MQKATENVVSKVKRLRDNFEDYRLEKQSMNKGPRHQQTGNVGGRLNGSASLGNLPNEVNSVRRSGGTASDLRQRLNRRFLGQGKNPQTDRYGRRINGKAFLSDYLLVTVKAGYIAFNINSI